MGDPENFDAMRQLLADIRHSLDEATAIRLLHPHIRELLLAVEADLKDARDRIEAWLPPEPQV